MPNEIFFGPWSGAVTADSAVIKVAVGQNQTAQLKLSRHSNLASAQTFTPNRMSVSEMTVLGFELTGLSPDTEYHYALEMNGALLSERQGRFRTFPPAERAASFKFVCAADASTGSNHAVFDAVRAEAPLFLLHLGDLHYEDVNSIHTKKYRQAYQRVHAAPRQAALYRSAPIAYMWDDHDYLCNNSHGQMPGRLAARTAYQECVPHYPLAEGTGDVAIYQAFTVGRVRFLLTDTRSARSRQDDDDGPVKSMLGTRQKQWLKDELLNGKDRYKLVVWVNSVPWIGKAEAHADEWFGYATERAELGKHLTDNGIRNVCMLSADAHMLAIDDGSHNHPPNGAGGFPVFHPSPLDRRHSKKGGPYSHKPIEKDSGQYGVFVVSDTGGATVRVEWIGKRLGEAAPLMAHDFDSPRA